MFLPMSACVFIAVIVFNCILLVRVRTCVRLEKLCNGAVSNSVGQGKHY